MNEQLPPTKIKIGQYSGKTLYSYDGMYWFYTIRSAVKAYWSLEEGKKNQLARESGEI